MDSWCRAGVYIRVPNAPAGHDRSRWLNLGRPDLVTQLPGISSHVEVTRHPVRTAVTLPPGRGLGEGDTSERLLTQLSVLVPNMNSLSDEGAISHEPQKAIFARFLRNTRCGYGKLTDIIIWRRNEGGYPLGDLPPPAGHTLWLITFFSQKETNSIFSSTTISSAIEYIFVPLTFEKNELPTSYLQNGNPPCPNNPAALHPSSPPQCTEAKRSITLVDWETVIPSCESPEPWWCFQVAFLLPMCGLRTVGREVNRVVFAASWFDLSASMTGRTRCLSSLRWMLHRSLRWGIMHPKLLDVSFPILSRRQRLNPSYPRRLYQLLRTSSPDQSGVVLSRCLVSKTRWRQFDCAWGNFCPPSSRFCPRPMKLFLERFYDGQRTIAIMHTVTWSPIGGIPDIVPGSNRVRLLEASPMNCICLSWRNANPCHDVSTRHHSYRTFHPDSPQLGMICHYAPSQVCQFAVTYRSQTIKILGLLSCFASSFTSLVPTIPIAITVKYRPCDTFWMASGTGAFFSAAGFAPSPDVDQDHNLGCCLFGVTIMPILLFAALVLIHETQLPQNSARDPSENCCLDEISLACHHPATLTIFSRSFFHVPLGPSSSPLGRCRTACFTSFSSNKELGSTSVLRSILGLFLLAAGLAPAIEVITL
ncbi:hypothetical protein VP01_1824g2 [Puccinia sorghi]|uniref:Uncharacterized protein n=1 Tax=Puccinia sorghi TaxID=27349 RepID=A0A0L6VFU4_9BASI|nr:hypothetical protein VP01_1824g2 [Puccinia sorghi]